VNAWAVSQGLIGCHRYNLQTVIIHIYEFLSRGRRIFLRALRLFRADALTLYPASGSGVLQSRPWVTQVASRPGVEDGNRLGWRCVKYFLVFRNRLLCLA